MNRYFVSNITLSGFFQKTKMLRFFISATLMDTNDLRIVEKFKALVSQRIKFEKNVVTEECYKPCSLTKRLSM